MLLDEAAGPKFRSRVGCHIAVPGRPIIPGVAKLSQLLPSWCRTLSRAALLPSPLRSCATGACRTEGFTSVELLSATVAELVLAGVPRDVDPVVLPVPDPELVLLFAPRRRTVLPLSSCTSNRSNAALDSQHHRRYSQLPRVQDTDNGHVPTIERKLLDR